MEILIFDDDVKTIAPTIPVLESNLGVRVNYMSDPTRALRQILAGGYKALVLEVLTPQISGLEICELLSFDERLKNIPVILVSDLPLYSDKFSRSLETHKELSVVKGVLEKPFTPYDLLAKITSVVSPKNIYEK